MTEQEKFNIEVQIRLTKQDAKFELFMNELQQQREDIRRMNERQDAMQAQHNADMKELREDIKGALKHIQGLTIATMVGIAAIAVGVLGFMWSSTRNTAPLAPPPAQSAQVRENAGNS